MNKLKITAYMFLLWTVFIVNISGCMGKNQIYLEAKEQELSAQSEYGNTAVDEMKDKDENVEDVPAAEPASKTCFVYICGAVKHPGVFEVPSGSRIYEVITLAGGLKKNASIKGLNQAQQIADGDMIEILTRKEQREAEKEAETEAKTGAKTAAGAQPGNSEDGRIDINTASATELMTLSGIGEAKAANIIAYREENGMFAATEEIMNVSGIGEGVYAQIKDKITVTS